MFAVKDLESLNYCHKFFIFREKKILLKNGALPSKEDFIEVLNKFENNFFYAEKDYGYASCIINELPQGFEEIFIREYFFNKDEEDVFYSARAYSLNKWQQNYKFCPKCGLKTFPMEKFSAYKCKSCGTEHFPRIEPCIIVLVTKGDEYLLVRHVQRNQDIFACIAGFIEVGESAEHAVIREVQEEVGIAVKNIKYMGSQSWPFPDQLMLAFRAEYESGEIKVQEEEISEAKWFSKSNLPACPLPGSVAYRLIHDLF